MDQEALCLPVQMDPPRKMGLSQAYPVKPLLFIPNLTGYYYTPGHLEHAACTSIP